MITIGLLVAAVVLVALGAFLGAEFQDRVHEDERRRLAEHRRQVNAAWRAVHKQLERGQKSKF